MHSAWVVAETLCSQGSIFGLGIISWASFWNTVGRGAIRVCVCVCVCGVRVVDVGGWRLAKEY